MIRLLLVAGEHSTRHALQMRFSAEHDLSVVGDSPHCEAALDAAVCHLPDVTLVDLDVVRAKEVGSEVALQTLCRRTPVIILTLHEDLYAQACMDRVRAAALVSKLEPVETLLSTIRQVAAGRVN